MIDHMDNIIEKQIETCLKDMGLKYTRHSKKQANDQEYYTIKFKDDLNSKEVFYEIAIIPSESLQSIRFLSLDFIVRDYDSKEFDSVNKILDNLNRGILFGYIFIDIDEKNNVYSLNFKHGVSLARNGQKLTSEELGEILVYIGFIVETTNEEIEKIK